MAARAENRPQARDYIAELFNQFYEIKGDRISGDDPAVVTGLAWFGGIPVTVIGQQKGKSLQERMACSFGMPHPAGYRKSMRVIRQAEKFNRPVICFIDTPGAYCGVTAEKENQGLMIAQHLRLMSEVQTPVISIIIGEGGSGGALALALCDRLLMLENTYFSVISPEGCASILFKDSTKAPEAAKSLALTPEYLQQMGLADTIIEEPEGLCIENMHLVTARLKKEIAKHIAELSNRPAEQLVAERQRQYLAMEEFVL